MATLLIGSSDTFAQETPSSPTLQLEIGECQDGRCLIPKAAAKKCKANEKKAEKFDDLADESKKIRNQRDECQARANRLIGERDEARARTEGWEDRALELKAENEALKRRPSPWVWIGVGAGGFVVLEIALRSIFSVPIIPKPNS